MGRPHHIQVAGEFCFANIGAVRGEVNRRGKKGKSFSGARQPLASPFELGTATKTPQSSGKAVPAQMLPFIGPKTPDPRLPGRKIPEPVRE
jgi:hypothetical protein